MCIELFVVIPDDSLYFCGINHSGDNPLYCFLLHLFGYSLFSFLLIWLAVYFVDLFKKLAPGFIDFFEGLFASLSPSVLILVIYGLLLACEFV